MIAPTSGAMPAKAEAVLCLAGLLALGGCSDYGSPLAMADAGPDGGPGAPGEAEVVIRSLAFVPQEIHIRAGGTVRWRMEDTGTFHFIVQGTPRSGETPSFESPRLDVGDEFSHTFTDRGTFVYYCSNHSGVMRDALVIVE